MQRPLASQPSAVQTVPSPAHGVALPLQVPPAQVSLSVQLFPSSHAAPFSRVGSPAQVPSWHASLAVQKFPSSHTVPFAWKVSGGHVALAPVHVSAASHGPAAGRHSTLLGWKASSGQVGLDPSQISATSHGPAAARQPVPAGLV